MVKWKWTNQVGSCRRGEVKSAQTLMAGACAEGEIETPNRTLKILKLFKVELKEGG